MISRAQKVRLGIFVFASLALFIVTLVSLTGMRLLDKKDTYAIRYHMSLSGQRHMVPDGISVLLIQ